MDVHDSYRQLREELLDRHSPASAIVVSGAASGALIPIGAGVVALLAYSLAAIARARAGLPTPLRPTVGAAVAAVGIVLYCGAAGVVAAGAWRVGDRRGQHGSQARFLAFVASSLPAALWCWSAIGGTSPAADTVVIGAAATALLAAMLAQLLWQGNYYDILDRVSPVRWADAAIRMLREDYYDDWLRYNRKLARFKHETQLVRQGEWDEFVRVEKTERRELREEESAREREVWALLRPDLYPQDLPRTFRAGPSAPPGARRWRRPAPVE